MSNEDQLQWEARLGRPAAVAAFAAGVLLLAGQVVFQTIFEDRPGLEVLPEFLALGGREPGHADRLARDPGRGRALPDPGLLLPLPGDPPPQSRAAGLVRLPDGDRPGLLRDRAGDRRAEPIDIATSSWTGSRSAASRRATSAPTRSPRTARTCPPRCSGCWGRCGGLPVRDAAAARAPRWADEPVHGDPRRDRRRSCSCSRCCRCVPVIIQAFWLGALGLLFLGNWPGGRGPAWETGEADPWPSAAAAARPGRRPATRPAARASGNGAGPAEPAAEPEPCPSDPAPASASASVEAAAAAGRARWRPACFPATPAAAQPRARRSSCARRGWSPPAPPSTLRGARRRSRASACGSRSGCAGALGALAATRADARGRFRGRVRPRRARRLLRPAGRGRAGALAAAPRAHARRDARRRRRHQPRRRPRRRDGAARAALSLDRRRPHAAARRRRLRQPRVRRLDARRAGAEGVQLPRPPAALRAMASYAGFDVLNLANNHVGDYGTAALLDTVRTCAASG